MLSPSPKQLSPPDSPSLSFDISSGNSSDTSPSSRKSPFFLSTMALSSDSQAAVRSLSENNKDNTPLNRQTIGLLHSQTASKGGCWTCRLRRKKCDEIRDGDSCQTCTRLKIKCLGWGTKRPDWMRDKQAVEAYKADIKAQLTRAGLIRGQPRNSLLATPSMPSSSTATNLRLGSLGADHSPHNVDFGTEPLQTSQLSSASIREFDPCFPHRCSNGIESVKSSLNDTANSVNANTRLFQNHRSPGLSFVNGSSSNLGLDLFAFSAPRSDSNRASNVSTTDSPVSSEALNIRSEFSHLLAGNTVSPFDTSALLGVPAPPLPGQRSIQGEHVIYYFENVRRMQYIFAENTITNITYQIILENPTGPVSNAVCAIASLHYTQSQISHGLELTEPDPEHSTAKYFHDEAWIQLATAKQRNGRYSESDIIAALHLITYASFSGRKETRGADGSTNGVNGTGVVDGDWQQPLSLALEWLSQTGLVTDESPRKLLGSMTETSRWLVKVIMWLDILSSVPLVRKPKYLELYRYLLFPFWNSGDTTSVEEVDTSLQMECICGFTDEALLGLAETAALAYWKASEARKGTLSIRELVRRGNAIDMRMQESQLRGVSMPSFGDEGTLNPSLLQERSGGQQINSQWPTSEMRRLAADAYRQSVYLYLHSVTSDCNPGVPEIRSTADAVAQSLFAIPYSEMDRALVFPICLTACLTSDLQTRQRLKQRLQQLELDAPMGKLFPVCAVVNDVWQRRESSRLSVDWRDVMRERTGSLLLV